MMHNNILLATDGSENARRAAAEAADLARELTSHVILVYIINTPPSQSRMAKANFDVHSLLEEDARSEIRDTIDIFENDSLPYTLKVAIGDPASEIIDIAEKEGADLIVIGSRGLGTIKGVFMGSVSQKVTHHAKCPVMIVK
jgi:nucleotide-binding universal stress UspA family protein